MGLAPFVDDDASRSSALRLAIGLGRSTWAAHAMVAIADRLDPPRQQQVLAALLETPRETERLRRLTLIRPRLASGLLDQWQGARDAIRVEIRGTGPEAPPILSIGGTTRPVAAQDEDAAVAERIFESLFEELSKKPAPVRPSQRPAPKGVAANGSALADMLRRLEAAESEDNRFDEIVRTLPRLTSSERLTLLSRLGDYLQPSRHDAAVPLVMAGLRDRDQRGFVDVLRRVRAPARVGPLLRACQAHLRPEMRADLLPAFRSALDDHARGDRRDALAMAEAWAPIVALLGGDAAAVATIRAIDAVAAQWP